LGEGAVPQAREREEREGKGGNWDWRQQRAKLSRTMISGSNERRFKLVILGSMGGEFFFFFFFFVGWIVPVC